jgi:hypothetical protein
MQSVSGESSFVGAIPHMRYKCQTHFFLKTLWLGNWHFFLLGQKKIYVCLRSPDPPYFFESIQLNIKWNFVPKIFFFFPVSCFKRRNNWNPTRLIQQFCSVMQFQNFIMVLCCMRVAIWSGFNCRFVLQSCAAIVQFRRQVINALVKYSFKMHNSQNDGLPEISKMKYRNRKRLFPVLPIIKKNN